VRFTHGTLALSYRSFGHGPLPIIAFHGFGRTGSDFAFLEQALGDRATIHAFDLPFHGESPSTAERVDRPFEPEELRDFFRAFADHLDARQLVLIGYSLGGRVALSLLATLPERISTAILLAPDGLKTKPWYRALASSAWGRWYYGRFVERPAFVQWIVRSLRALGLMSEKMHRFLSDQTSTREKRDLVRNVWLSFRHVEPELGKVAEQLKAHGITVHLVFGRQDRVIRTVQGQALARHDREHVRIHEVEAGHRLLTPATADFLRGLLG
jgi:pimeloyl-ACP methyl ester carboxylesterase